MSFDDASCRRTARVSGDILVLNSGSSSIKFSLFGNGARVARDIEHATRLDHARALAIALEWVATLGPSRALAAVGHRVVHGGAHYSAPVMIDETVIRKLQALVPLAPLHQAHNLAGARAVSSVRPGVPQVACFDTAFHRTQSTTVQHYALPRALTASGIHRYGFHGLSYEYVAQRLHEMAPEVANGKVVIAHLGNGASLCAIKGGRSIDSTMGFTALDGVPMGTRCGALDPGVVLYWMSERGMSCAEISDVLYTHSGLLGMSEISNDMRILLKDASAEAQQAVDQFVYRVGSELGAMAAALGGLDALVFTGGIGEHAALVSERGHGRVRTATCASTGAADRGCGEEHLARFLARCRARRRSAW